MAATGFAPTCPGLLPEIRRMPGFVAWRMTRTHSRAAAALAGLVLALACAGLGALRYEPFLFSVRDTLLPVLVASGLGLAFYFRPRRGGHEPDPPPRWLSRLRLTTFIAALVSIAVTTAAEARFQAIRSEVMAAPADDLARLGRHIIIGIDEPYEVRKLIELRAIAGIFVTRRNAKGMNTAKLAASIRKLDEQHRALGGSPLWVTADQEGGVVQRLSPPLPKLPPLAQVLAKHTHPVSREAAVRAYAREQGKSLAAVGVNVNFAPVVDLDFGLKNRNDRYTRISQRAISCHPATVADAASWYCEGLWSVGVRCTRKHFPGLGRVFADTHVREATLSASLDELVAKDWVPFEAKETRPDWVMVGHMRVAALDPDRPASASPAVIQRLRGLGHSGIVVTDDFSMGAISRSKLGIGGAAVEAINAGVDLVLISYDSDQIFRTLHALLAADREGRLDRGKLEESDTRLARAAELQTAELRVQ